MACSLLIVFLFTILVSPLCLASEATNATRKNNKDCSSPKFVSEAPPIPRPVDTPFKFPSAIPKWSPSPARGGFGSGVMDLGGVQVRAVTTFTKIWTTYVGGENDTGATFFEPAQVPPGFSMLGSYAQPNNRPLFGSVLVAKATAPGALKPPVDYKPVWSSQCFNVTRDRDAFFWEPVCAPGYSAAGHLVTTAPSKPPLSKVQCVSSALTDRAERRDFVWSTDGDSPSDDADFQVFTLWPNSTGVPVGSFWGSPGGSTATDSASVTTLVCLKNNNKSNINASMPNLKQIDDLVESYSPHILLSPDEKYLPCSVNWFLSKVKLFRRGVETPDPALIQPNGTNLPSGGSDDGLYWLDSTAADRDIVKQGNMSSAQVYVQAKPMFGGATTYLTFWTFFAFKGPAKFKIGNVAHLQRLSLGPSGEHLGDWKHLTLAVRNLDGALTGAFYGANGGGQWVQPWEMEFRNGTNKPVAYAAHDGHGFYPAVGVYVKGVKGVGIRSDTAEGGPELDAGGNYSVIAADYLGVVSPPWVEYLRRWGPSNTNTIAKVLDKLGFLVPAQFKIEFEAAVLLLNYLPPEVVGGGSVGPKAKKSWDGDEHQSAGEHAAT